MDQETSAAVPLFFENEPLPVTEGIGVLVQNLDTVTVQALPADLPAGIRVDVSVLEQIGEKLTVADLPVGPNVTILSDPDEWVVQVVPTRVAKAEFQELTEGGVPGELETEETSTGEESEED